LEGFR
jgi:hypothetical protein